MAFRTRDAVYHQICRRDNAAVFGVSAVRVCATVARRAAQ
jgi:hypothetical protein